MFQHLQKTVGLDSLNGKWLIIDGNFVIYKYGIGIRKMQAINNKRQADAKLSNHVFTVVYFSHMLMQRNIKPFWVFDGINVSDMKTKIITKRNDRITTSKEKLEEVEGEDYIKHYKKSLKITSDMYNECKHALDLMGVAHMSAFGEADADCAMLSGVNNDICGVYTEDSDILMFGGECIFSGIDFETNTIKSITKNDTFTYLKYLSGNVLTYEKYLKFMIIMGTDYCAGIKGISKNVLFKFYINCNMDTNEMFEKIRENKNKITIDDTEYKLNYQRSLPMKIDDIYQLYSNATPEFDAVDIQTYLDTKKEPDIERLKLFLTRCNFDKPFILNIIKNISDDRVV